MFPSKMSTNLVVCKNSAPRLEPFAGGDWNPDDRGWWIQWIQYNLVMTNIATENPLNKWRFVAGKIIYFYGPFMQWLC